MSSKEFFFSSGNAYCALAVTPASFGPCSTFALANAGSERASALPAPSLRNSRRRTYNHFGVTSDERMSDLRDDPTPPARARLRFRGFRLADDGRDPRRQRLGLLRRGELARVVLAEPAVAGAGARLSAAGDRAQPPRAPAVEMDARAAAHLNPGQRRGHLLFHLARDDGGQLAREPVDDRAKRRIPCLICHAIVPYSQISAAKAAQPHSFLSRGASQCERKQQLPAEQALQPVLSLFFQLLAFRLRFRLRALLRVGLHLPCLLLRGLLRLRRIDAEGAPEH